LIARLILPLCLVLAGCTENGDFGRPRPSVWNDMMLPAAGDFAAGQRGEPVSSFNFTDDEAELRDRSWRFIMPAHDKLIFQRQLAELVRTRVRPLGERPVGRDLYHRALMHRTYHQRVLDEAIASPVSRYRRVSEDAFADSKLIPVFTGLAARVLATDRIRLRALTYVRQLDEAQVRDAAARVAENRCLIAWVRQEAADRAGAYAYALERLIIETPQRDSIEVERALAALDVSRGLFDALGVPPFPEACWAPVAPPPPADPPRPPLPRQLRPVVK
jgi:hypothetical protein